MIISYPHRSMLSTLRGAGRAWSVVVRQTRNVAKKAENVPNKGKRLREERKSMRANRDRRVLREAAPEEIPLYSNPYRLFDRALFVMLTGQVVLTTGALIYIATPLQDHFPLPQSVVDRFIPRPDPDSELAHDIVVQNTAQRWVLCISVAWVASCLALYFKHRQFLRHATAARLVHSPLPNRTSESLLEEYELQINYFFARQKSFRSAEIVRESQISAKEWSIICKPDKPFTYFVFQEAKLSGASRGLIQNFMHKREMSATTLRNFDQSKDAVDPGEQFRGYVYGANNSAPLKKS